MIDTLKLLIPIKDLELLERLEGNLTRFRKEDLRKGQIEFEFHSSSVPLGTHHRKVMLKSTKNLLGIFVECSFAKYSLGNNVEMIHPHDLPAIADQLHTELCQYLGIILPPINTWPVYRLDVCYNWLLDSHDEALYAMDFIQRIDYPRKKKYRWDTSVMYTGTAYTVKFYLKGDEFLKHDYKELEENRAYVLQQWAKRILRYEVGLRRTYLTSFFGQKYVYLPEIANDDTILDVLQHFLNRTFHYINPTSTTEAEVSRILRENFSKTKAMNLYLFYKGYFFDERTRAMYENGGMHRSTIYRHKRDLKRVGIGHDLEPRGKGILEKLVIPSPVTRFRLAEMPPGATMLP